MLNVSAESIGLLLIKPDVLPGAPGASFNEPELLTETIPWPVDKLELLVGLGTLEMDTDCAGYPFDECGLPIAAVGIEVDDRELLYKSGGVKRVVEVGGRLFEEFENLTGFIDRPVEDPWLLFETVNWPSDVFESLIEVADEGVGLVSVDWELPPELSGPKLLAKVRYRPFDELVSLIDAVDVVFEDEYLLFKDVDGPLDEADFVSKGPVTLSDGTWFIACGR